MKGEIIGWDFWERFYCHSVLPASCCLGSGYDGWSCNSHIEWDHERKTGRITKTQPWFSWFFFFWLNSNYPCLHFSWQRRKRAFICLSHCSQFSVTRDQKQLLIDTPNYREGSSVILKGLCYRELSSYEATVLRIFPLLTSPSVNLLWIKWHHFWCSQI